MSANPDANPMHPRVDRLNRAPRCGARSRDGDPCRSPAVRGKARCRMHGACAGAPEGERNGAWRHGMRSGAYRLERMFDRMMLRLGAEALAELDGEGPGR